MVHERKLLRLFRLVSDVVAFDGQILVQSFIYKFHSWNDGPATVVGSNVKRRKQRIASRRAAMPALSSLEKEKVARWHFKEIGALL